MNYHAIIIGSGQSGNPLAQRLAADGKSVALIELGPLGGTCINTGCTPTKAMIGSAQVAHYARNAERWGVRVASVEVDLPAVLRRKNEIVKRSRSTWERKFEGKENPHLYRGKARFIGPRQIEVNGQILSADRVFINAGARASVPDIPGLSSIDYLTNVNILELQEVPEHLIVLGGGYVGLEFGQMFRRFGSKVTVIQSADRILPNEDDDITQELRACLESEGIRFLLNTHATRVERSAGSVAVTARGGVDDFTVAGTHLLVATGRVPNTVDLDLLKTGVEVDEKGFVIVDEHLKTTADNIWALGDVKGGPQFTHISYNDFQIIYANVYEGKQLSIRSRIVPYAVYTDPTLGRVGLTEKAARAQGHKLKIGKIPMAWVARAIERGEPAGAMKVVVDADNDRILGASILAAEGGELVQILHTLMLADQPYTLLKGAIYIHPTLAEGFFSLLESVKAVA